MKKNIHRLLFVFLCAFALSACNKEEPTEKKETQKETQKEPDDDIRTITDNNTDQNTSPKPEKKNILIALDPGHQSYEVDMSDSEANGPGSADMKPKASTGTVGKFSNIPEYQLTMDISLLVKEELEKRGYDVMLTRSNNETAISNAERAQLANDSRADISVRIHANGSEDSSVSGALALAPSPKNPYISHLSEKSALLAQKVLDAYCTSTGMINQGIQMNDTMTGINWSQIPVIILEMGYMSNEHDDLQMANTNFHSQMVEGIVNGIDQYYGVTPQPIMSAELNSQLETTLSKQVQTGEKWSVYTERLSDGTAASFGEEQIKAASLIKLFLAATVHQNLALVKTQETGENDTANLLHIMIANSDNDATNTLITRLGSGDPQKGMALVNAFCGTNGYTQTHMGRLMLDVNASDENYTSAKECAALIKSLYKKELPGAEEILHSMQQQTRIEKIPAGVPKGIVTANKTGELDHTEHDAALIYVEGKDYVLCIMADNLVNSATACATIREVSELVYIYMTN